MMVSGHMRVLCTLHKMQQLSPVMSAFRLQNVRNYRNPSLPRTSGFIANKTAANCHSSHQFDKRHIHTSCTDSSRAGTEMNKEKVKISPTLTLAQAPDKGLNTQDNNPLVLFFPWLGATPRAIDKYCDLYHQQGWDVLVVNATAKHFLWPANAKVIAEELLDYVMSKDVQEERTDFMVHSMSIGAFIYTVVFIELQEQSEKYINFRNKLRGQIFDSIVIGGLKHMGKGVSASITSNPIGGLSIRGLIALYLGLTKKHTVDYYDYSVKFFHDKPVTIPTLIYFSMNDEFSDPNAMENLIGTWRAQHPRMNVTYKCWVKSAHTGHLQLHRQEYIAEMTNFLAKLDLVDDIVRVKSHL